MQAFDGAPFTAAILHSRLITIRWRLAFTPIYALLSEYGGHTVTICPSPIRIASVEPDLNLPIELEATEPSQYEHPSIIADTSPSSPRPVEQTIDTRVLLSVSVVQDASHDVSNWVSWLTSAAPWDVTKVDVQVHSVFKSYSTLIIVSIPTSIWDRLPERPAYRFIGFIRSGDCLQAAKTSTTSVSETLVKANRTAIRRDANSNRAEHFRGHGSTDHTEIVQDFIWESLAFTAMKDREEDVVEAHGETLDWLFSAKHGSAADEPVASFPTWLRGDQSIFWVNGKPGSGKSTLMRFLLNNRKTFEELRKWAGKRLLVTAGYYFWSSGSVEQRSQAGLLRYLLFQLLQEHRHLIPITFPKTWKEYVNSSTKDRIKAEIVWKLPELTEGMTLSLQTALHSLKICLFVEGLDEFDGDNNDIIQFFKRIPYISEGNLKLCLSSRPWTFFTEAFQNFLALRLHDLTYQDMVQYVTDKFEGDEGLGKMLHDEVLEGEKLVTELVERAYGNFLWATLVVRSLAKSFCEGDRVVDLQKRLLRIPTDLADLFQYILFDIQADSSLQEASSIFQLLHAREVVCESAGEITSTSLTLWELALAQEPYEEPIVDTGLQREKNEDALRRCQDTKSIVNGCCAGLLEIKDNTRQHLRGVGIEGHSTSTSEIKLIRSKVTYIHRTVRDFLIRNAWDALLKYTTKGFDPHICHIVSFVLQLKLALHKPTQHRSLDDWWPGIVLSMTHARLSHPHSAARQNHLINQIKSTVIRHWLSPPPEILGHEAQLAPTNNATEPSSTIVFSPSQPSLGSQSTSGPNSRLQMKRPFRTREANLSLATHSSSSSAASSQSTRSRIPPSLASSCPTAVIQTRCIWTSRRRKRRPGFTR